jgi:hypothetical protein
LDSQVGVLVGVGALHSLDGSLNYLMVSLYNFSRLSSLNKSSISYVEGICFVYASLFVFDLLVCSYNLLLIHINMLI